MVAFTIHPIGSFFTHLLFIFVCQINNQFGLYLLRFLYCWMWSVGVCRPIFDCLNGNELLLTFIFLFWVCFVSFIVFWDYLFFFELLSWNLGIILLLLSILFSLLYVTFLLFMSCILLGFLLFLFGSLMDWVILSFMFIFTIVLTLIWI